MPLYLTAAHSSKLNKPGRSSDEGRTSSSSLSSVSKTKSAAKRKSKADDSEGDAEDFDENLEATGKILPVIQVALATDVLSAIHHTTTTIFCSIPDRAGMSSTRIAQVLNFQKNLPPLVSLAHIHALISSSSKTERQISALLAASRLRKIKISGRGNDVSGYGEVLVTMVDLQLLLQRSGVVPDTVSSLIEALRQNPRATSLPRHVLSAPQTATLIQAGFLVSASFSGSRNLSLSGATHVAVPSISRAASGTSNAVGGEAAFENLGGVGAARRSDLTPGQSTQADSLAISVPNIGPYLRLLDAGRSHLMELLGKSKYREAPLYLLRERWDGAVDSDNRISTAKRVRGEFANVAPAKTKKWKDLYGLNFDWVLEECLGAGMLELFETKSVGLGVRALT